MNNPSAGGPGIQNSRHRAEERVDGVALGYQSCGAGHQESPLTRSPSRALPNARVSSLSRELIEKPWAPSQPHSLSQAL